MEKWEDVIDNYPDNPDIRYFAKIIETANVIIKEDLANFEIEWIIETLLSKPVNLLVVISQKRNDNDWSKTNENCFKLLKEIVKIHHEHLKRYSEDIDKLCQLQYDNETRRAAIECLTALAVHFPPFPADVKKHIAALSNSMTCRAPLAVLVGTICKYHFELVTEDYTNIWRTYLNMLDCNKNTNKLTSAVLQGIHDLFEYYGRELQTRELSEFYDKMAAHFLRKPKSDTVCLSILENYSYLFREKLAKDGATLDFLWRKLQDGLSTKCVMNVYQEILEVLKNDRKKLQQILTEILPRTQSTNYQTKYASLTIAHLLRTSYDVHVDLMYPDVQPLEFELQIRQQGLDEVYQIAFCIEASLPNFDKLLQTAVLFYDNLPATRRKEIVVDSIMEADEELRTSTINFLIKETCQADSTLDKHTPLWNDLASHQMSDVIFSDVIRYTCHVLTDLAMEEFETLPPEVANLLTLCAHLVSLIGEDSRCREQCLVLAKTLRGFPAANVWRQLALCIPEDVPYSDFDIERCTDEQTLCDFCLIIINAPIECMDLDNVLTAYQIIFSRKDVDPKTLCQSLKKFETIMNIVNKQDFDKTLIAEILRSIEKLILRKDLVGKDARVLHRDVIMFLGKYGTSTFIKESDNTLNNLIVKLKDKFVLNLPNPHEGTNYKINLNNLLHLALTTENVDALRVLMTVLYAESSSRDCKELQSALCETAVRMCRCVARGDCSEMPSTDALAVGCGMQLVDHITKEKSPGVRKLLCDILADLLIRDPGSDEAEELVRKVADEAQVMMRSPSVTSKMAALDITHTLLDSLKKNNLLAKRILPNLITNLPKTKEYDFYKTFDEASKIFIEKIDLFDNDIDLIVDNLLKESIQNGGEINMADEKVLKVYRRTVKTVLEFLKRVYEVKKRDSIDLLERCSRIFYGESKMNFSMIFYILSEFRKIFNLHRESYNIVLADKDCFLMKKLFCMEMDDVFCMEAVLKFMDEYSDSLLELNYEKTLEFLSKIKYFTPNNIVLLERTFQSCLKNYSTKFDHTPRLLFSSVEQWCNNLKLRDITHALEKDYYTSEHALKIHSLKIMLNSVKTGDLLNLTDVKNETQKWPRILLNSFASGFLTRMTSKLAYLSDLLSVSVKLSKCEIKNVILEGHNVHGVSNERIGVKFAKYFIDVFFEHLIEKPFKLMDEEMSTCCILLNDIVKYALRKKCTDAQYDQVLDLVDKLWPTYETQTTFPEKHTLLLNLAGLPKCLGRDSNPIAWACGVVQSDAGREEKARLISVLPGGKDYCAIYNSFASTLPTRLSESSGALNASLRALLDALAATADLRLLEIVMALADGDSTKGWWDSAIQTCICAVGARARAGAGAHLLRAAYRRGWGRPAIGACYRVLVPLLRYSQSQKCEEFYSAILPDLMPRLKRGCREGVSKNEFLKYVLDYTRAFVIITLAFEKLPRASLESPSSVLYKDVEATPWWLVKEALKWGSNLSILVEKFRKSSSYCDDEEVKECCRQFQCARYNCACAALCTYRPPPGKYSHLLGADTWGLLLDCTRLYNLPLVSKWNRRSITQPSSISVQSRSTSLRSATSTRTRLFLRTLSEYVLQYDLHEQESREEMVTQELNMSETQLNDHECATTLTSLWCHLSTVDSDWHEKLASALASDCHRNVKWLLAQTICNARQELKPQSSKLRLGLLKMVSDTLVEKNDKRLLNGLHLDVLETLIFCGDDTPQPSQHLNNVVSCLLTTCLENRQRQNLFNTLMDVTDKFLSFYGRVVEVKWFIFRNYLNENTQEASKTLNLLKHVTKSGVYMPELLSEILDYMSKGRYQLSKLSELFGLALSRCQNNNEVDNALRKWRQLLESKRNQAGEYVKMLYHAQMNYTGCCDEARFRVITDLTLKMPTSDKNYCLKILSSYLSTEPPTEIVQDMFDCINMGDVIMEGSVEGFSVVREGLKGVNGVKRNALINQVAGYCQHSAVKIRKAALEVMLRAFQDIFKKTETQNLPKKPRNALVTSIIQSLETESPVITATVLKCVSLGLSDFDEEIRNVIKDGVSECLRNDHMGVRFIEAFILCIYMPIIKKCTNNLDHNVGLSTMFDLLLRDLRKQERFQQVRLRDEPISVRESTSKLYTTSKACVGTFRTTASSRKRINVENEDTNKPNIDVQITIDSILDILLNFTKQSPEASNTFLTELTSNFATSSPQFDARSSLAKMLNSALDYEPSPLTPVVLLLIDNCVDYVAKENGIQQKLDDLKCLTLNSEATFHLTLLCEEVSLLNATCDQPLYSCNFDEGGEDINMADNVFSVDDLKSIFGKLSNWDDLTARQKRCVLNEGLPPLWTDKQTFNTAINGYIDEEGWFSKMVSAYKKEDRHNSIKWLRDVDKWPRRRFDISATTEAMEYIQGFEDNQTKLNCDIQPSDCLAEWAARFMIRTAYLTTLESDNASEIQKLSRSYELKWCERANEMQLSQCVLDCVKRNTSNDDLFESEILPWLCQKVEALRCVGRRGGDLGALDRALTTAEKFAPEFFKDSPSEYIIKISQLTLELYNDLGMSSKGNIEKVFDEIQKRCSRNDFLKNQKCREMMFSMCELATNYYYDSFRDSSEKEELLIEMAEILEYSIESNNQKSHLILCLILERLKDFDGSVLSNKVAKKILDSVTRIHPNLNEFTLEALKSQSHLFSSLSLTEYPFMSERDGEEMEKFKKCFQLVMDAEYMLSQYCNELFRALKCEDGNQWKVVHERMRQKIFENEYAGVDYQVLKKYKNDLYEIRDFEPTQTFKTKAETTLSAMRCLSRSCRYTLRVSQVCPSLAAAAGSLVLAKLLRLPHGLRVDSFDEQVSVFTDSIRRPCVLRARLSGGGARRYLVKPGECLRTDAAAVSLCRVVSELAGARCTTYQIIPLSDDCGLIEFLEGHERLRSIIQSQHDIDSASHLSNRPADDELILSLPASLRHHNALCQQVPSRSLRSAIKCHSLNIEDYWNRRVCFTETVAAYTIIGWILGLADRHLHNTLYSTRDGGICLVDWNAVFQYGRGELPPARLTRNVMAVCDLQVLESRLQKILTSLRKSQRIFLAVSKITFGWMGEQFWNKYPYIEAIMKGKLRSYEITKDSIENSKVNFKNRYIELLDQVFDNWPRKESYTVEDQISCLLQQCTDNRILAVTRSGWEPWI